MEEGILSMSEQYYTDQLLDAALEFPTDFKKMEKLLELGADINGMADEESILAEVLCGYSMDTMGIAAETGIENPEEAIGKNMVRLIRFFLDHGYDVERNRGAHGTDCVFSLCLSTFDRYALEGLRLFLEAGTDVTREPKNDYDSTSLGYLGVEATLALFDEFFSSEVLFETMYTAAEHYSEGKPWSGIDMYDQCIGKIIHKVWVSEKQPIPFHRNEDCLEGFLYVEYEDGVLRIDREGIPMTDDRLPEETLQDVTHLFPEIIGKKITSAEIRSENPDEEHYVRYFTITAGKVLIFRSVVTKTMKGRTRHRSWQTTFRMEE